jgi:large conductance mechanosensitive channel
MRHGVLLKTLEEFKEFLTKENVVSLAVAVVIGAAISSLVTAFTTGLITPLIGIPGHINFTNVTYTIHGSTFKPGLFVNALINFVIIAAVVFFLIIRPINKLNEKLSAGKKAGPTSKVCPYCLSTIPLNATRCAFCTSRLKK